MPRVARLGNGLITGPYAKMLCTAPSTYHLAMDDSKQLKIQGGSHTRGGTSEWLQSHGGPNPRILAHQAQDRPELILFRGFLTKRNGPGKLLPGLPGSSLNQFSE